MKNNLPIIAILALALVVRLLGITQSFWLDEAAQAIESARPLSQQLNIIPDFQPPLFHLVVHFWMLAGKSEWWLRLASLIPGLITIYATIRLGEKLKDRHTGIIAGVLLATSQFHVFYSQELRPYSLAAMWALLSTLSLVSYWQDKKKRSLYTFILLSICGIYTTYLYPVFLAAQILITLIFHTAVWKPMLVAGGIIALSFLPWFPTFKQQLSTGTTLAQNTPAWSTVVSPPLAKMLPLTVFKFLVGRITDDAAKSGSIFMYLAGYVFLHFGYKSFQEKRSKEVFSFILIPLVLALGISIVVPVLDPKRILFCLPFIYLFTAMGINRRYPAAIGVLVLLNLNLFALKTYATNADQQREPWREAIQSIESHMREKSVVVFTFPEPVAPWLWYANPQTPVLAVLPDSQNMNELGGYQTVFLFEYLADIADPNRQVAGALGAGGFAEVDFLQYPGIGKIHILTKQPTFAYKPY